MKASEKNRLEFEKLLERVIILKDNVHGENKWSKNLLPKDIDGCKFYIKYCKENYFIIG